MTDKELHTNAPGRDEQRPAYPEGDEPPSQTQAAQDPSPGAGPRSERSALESREAIAQYILDGERRGQKFPRRRRRAARAILRHHGAIGGRHE